MEKNSIIDLWQGPKYVSKFIIIKDFVIYNRLFKDTHRENKHPQIKQALTKSMNVDIWVAGTLNLLFIKGSYAEIKFFKKIKKLVGRLCSLWRVSFVLSILFVLALVFDKTVLHGNVLFSMEALSSEK